jgi:hypothetical protein
MMKVFVARKRPKCTAGVLRCLKTGVEVEVEVEVEVAASLMLGATRIF